MKLAHFSRPFGPYTEQSQNMQYEATRHGPNLKASQPGETSYNDQVSQLQQAFVLWNTFWWVIRTDQSLETSQLLLV